jgi:cardiolipin synthase A/B
MCSLRRIVVVALLAYVLGGGVAAARADAAAQVDARVSAGAATTVFAEPRAGSGPVLALIRGAKYRIRLEVYELTDSSVINALASAKRRHVWVEVILEQHPFGTGNYAQEAYNSLHRDGVSVRWANESAFTYTHEKAIDIDNRVAGIFTFNLSYSAFSSNREFGVVDRSGRDARQIGSIFDADWKRGRAKLTDYQLVVSPINSRSAITHLIDGARHTLDLYEEEMADTSIESHLVAAAKRHVRVRLITSDDRSGVEAARSGGVRVVLMSSPYVHAKAIVADGARVFIGSENISSTSLDDNREMGIILSSRRAVSVVASTFQQDWAANGGNPPPARGGKLTLSVSARPHSVVRGELLTIAATTTPSASCTITVTYPDGYVSHASELQGARIADSSGQIHWSWHMGSTVTGTAHAAVTCRLGQKSDRKTTSFVIRN